MPQNLDLSLCNTSYKIVSKIIANRLRPILNRIISPFQAAFLQGRQMSDNIILAPELIDTMKKNKTKTKGLMAIKLDMSKDFDRVEWCFIIHSLHKLGYHEDFCRIIEQCISTVSMSVLLNGSPGDIFYPERCLREGDPLTPYLFILCMEFLSKCLLSAESKGLYNGIRVTPDCPPISRLFVADDCLIFLNAIPSEARVLHDIIRNFSNLSGQSINFEKPGLAFSPKTDNRIKNDIAKILGIKRMGLQDK